MFLLAYILLSLLYFLAEMVQTEDERLKQEKINTHDCSGST
jgi:hypothetical protein